MYYSVGLFYENSHEPIILPGFHTNFRNLMSTPCYVNRRFKQLPETQDKFHVIRVYLSTKLDEIIAKHLVLRHDEFFAVKLPSNIDFPHIEDNRLSRNSNEILQPWTNRGHFLNKRILS